MKSVLFVCLGNICRSPTAEAVFRARAAARGLEDALHIDSAGTGDWHLGKAPDRRAQEAAARRGYDLSPLRARQVTPEDLRRFDLVLAMDDENLRDLQQLGGNRAGAVLYRLMDFHPEAPVTEVPDPYYGTTGGFEHVLDLIETASDHLLDWMQESS